MSSTKPHRNPVKRIARAIAIPAVLLLTLAGCSLLGSKDGPSAWFGIEPYGEILEASYAAADMLAEDLVGKRINRHGAIMSASLVNIDNLEESCSLGRVISEQVSSRIAYHGFRVLEMKLRQKSVYIKKGQGEFLLSREIQEISKSHNSAYVMVGTYAVAEGGIYVSLRIVNAVDNAIVTGCDYQLLRNYQTNSLLSRF